MNRELKQKLERAFHQSDWLTLCAVGRVLISLNEGPGMRSLPRLHFNWRSSQRRRGPLSQSFAGGKAA
jgi:hypothetical protein